METPEYEELIDEDENEEPSATPLWMYVTKIYAESSAKGGGGSNKFVCNFGCRSEPYFGSYTRVRSGSKSAFWGNSKARKLPAGKSAVPPHPRNDIDKMFMINYREDVDQQIARCMYENGIPFNVVRSPLWHDMISTIRLAPAGYVCPNYEKIRTTLLDKEYNKVKQNLKPLMDDWDIYGLSMISDGFANCKNQSLINVMAASKGKAMFLSAHECSSIEKRGERRKKPHFDIEVQKGYFHALDILITDPTESGLVRQQISDFSVTSSCAERCWSTYSYIHNVKRNRLGAARAEKLVFVHYNGRLLTRFREDYESNYKNCDANPEITNIEQSGASLEAVEAYEKDDDIDEANDDDIATTNPMTPGRSSTPSLTAITPTSTTLTPHSSTPPAQDQEVQRRLRLARTKRKLK
ncbi:hypothetical protein RJ639_045781 [Escallonia herrerae]|uniref:DUF659 domain-containing protein n=1 Tax=Escallonia herrerae TaxID=1293975 RepID=A0AA89AYA7_9ASTE|nr:hypothetical protein RJ639_045781 [Escallonia herrerae]